MVGRRLWIREVVLNLIPRVKAFAGHALFIQARQV